MEEQNPKQTEDTSIGNIAEEIEKLKQEKENLSKQQEEHKAQLEELTKLKAEIEELKKFKFPEEKAVQAVDTIELIKNKFKQLDYAIENYPVGHPERSPFTLTDSYNSQGLLDGYYRYTKGEKIEDIFKNPLE